ncbi:MAG: hypothetical protein AB8H47_01285 [Bacteroidia bacterium]
MLFLSCTETLSDVGLKRQTIEALVQSSQQKQTYIYEEEGEEIEEEQQWSQIDRQNGNWAYLEVYNQFLTESGQQEYNLYEFQFDPHNVGARFPILEYELRIYQDSAWFALTNELEASLDSVLIHEVDTLYRLLGYAHKGDPAPGHMRYWSPEYGTVLTWYGESRYFELHKAYQGLDPARLTLLKGLAFQDTQKQ